jgi:predicted transposase YbfD/YdcC
MNETDATLALVSSIVGVIPDPRRGNHVRHAARDLLFAAIIAMLCGCDSYEGFSRFAEHKLGWLRSKGFAFANGVPPHDAFYWLFRKLDPSLLSACLRSIAAGLRGKAGAGDFEVVAIDGKAARRGVGRGGKTPYIVNAWSSAGGYVLGGVKVEEKSNEITAVPKLLDLLRLEGCVVTLDAMGCQRDIAKRIVGRNADYVLALKGNQGTMFEEMKLLFETMLGTNPEMFVSATEKVRKAHGRIEKRTCWQTERIDWFEDKVKWEGLKSVAMVEAERTTRDPETGEWKTTKERRLYISSLANDPKKILKAVRRHWGVEIMHWTLDVAFGEDYCRARSEHAAENRATLRRIGYDLLRRYGRRHKCATKTAMMDACLREGALDEMISA